jgi:hypothetical protein
MSTRLEYGLTIRQVNKILKAIAPLNPTISETPIQDLPARVQARLVEHQRGQCSCVRRRKNCKRVQQGILNRALNEIPSRRVPLFRPHEIANYSAYANGHLSNYAAAEDVELRAIRYALANNLRDLVRPLANKDTEEHYVTPCQPEPIDERQRFDSAEDSGLDDPADDVVAQIGGHVITEGVDDNGREKPLKTFDKTVKASKKASDWVEDALAKANRNRSRSSAYSRVEAQFNDLFIHQKGRK